MASVKQQKIVVFISFSPNDVNLISYGARLARIFKKELCLVANLRKNSKNQFDSAERKLQEYIVPSTNKFAGLHVSGMAMRERKGNLPQRLADEFEAIILVAAAGEFSKYSKPLTESPIPFLFVDAKNSAISDFKKLVLPIDLRAENSETALWSSYFGRFNHAAIVAVAANDKGKEEQKQVTKNVVMTKRIYKKFNIAHKIFKGNKSSLRNSFEALGLANASKSDLLLLLGSSTITPLDKLIGLPERKIVKQAGNLPVLVVNPRKDNYILCD